MKHISLNVPETFCVGKVKPQEVRIIERSNTRKVFPFLRTDNKWYIRFIPTRVGIVQVEYDSKKIEYSVDLYKGTNPLYLHGPLTFIPGKKNLTHSDGTVVFLLIDTWWFAMTKRTTDDELALLIADRKKKGFNAVQFVIAFPPETATDSPDASNQGGFPLLNDICNPAYFEVVDRRIQMIVDAGLIPIIYGSWGHHIDTIGKELMKLLWKEILARYSEYPCVLSVCGEIDVFLSPKQTAAQPLSQSLLKKKLALNMPILYEKASASLSVLRAIKHDFLEGKLLQLRLLSWNEIAEWIFLHNQTKRPLTVHVSRKERASHLLHNPHWLTIDSIQSGHSQAGLFFMRQALDAAANDQTPIINLEPWYEGILHNFDAYHQRKAVWISLLSGAIGHGYGAHGLWQMATRHDNFMSHWGDSEWKQALDAPGAVILGKSLAFFIHHGGLNGKPFELPLERTVSIIHKPLSFNTQTYLFIYVPQKQYLSFSDIHLPFRVKVVYWYNPDTLALVKKEEIQGDTLSLELKDYPEQDLLILAAH